MATMSMMVDSSVMLDSIPRLRWSPKNNRFHYNMPVAAEPGDDGFVLLQEFEHADSLNAFKLPAKEQVVMDTIFTRMHHEEFHERDVHDEEERPQGLKKKDSFRQRQQPKRSFQGRRQKPTRMGRVHQPK
ncbi:Hypothetical protein PHPALM_734 [Phytophthora palmivora]|uniref:Uncharacterized protein n=1 Tax=Phytophthora palmivora TaxID=4796 RepID=A0A2P4YU33_9STRA|nr:Hypothetical protein PHPALM_734 [Phytophthora palmivora]